MTTETGSHISELQRIASRPARIRKISLMLLAGFVVVFVIGYLWSISNPEFKMKGLPPTLSKEVSAVVEGYSRVEVASDGSNFTVTAKRATTFIDNHQEFEGVRIEFPGTDGPDIVAAERAVFLPGNGNGFKLFLERSVDLTSSTGFKITTSAMVYDNGTSLGETEGPLDFNRGELKGSAVGARYDSRTGNIDLLGKVSVKGVKGPDSNGEMTRLGVSRLDMTANRGVVSTRNRTLVLTDNVRFGADVLPDSQGAVPSSLSAKAIEIKLDGNEPSEITSTGGVRAQFLPTKKRTQQIDVQGESLNANLRVGDERLSISGLVKITIADPNGPATEFSGPRLSYEFDGGRISGDGGVKLERRDGGVVQTATANRIEYSLQSREFSIRERARFVSESDYFEADTLKGKFGNSNELISLAGEGASRVGRDDSKGKSETRAKRFQASFKTGGKMREVSAIGPVISRFISKSSSDSATEVLAPRGVKLLFDDAGNISNLATQGRTTIKLSGREEGGDRSGTLSADTVLVRFDSINQRLRIAEARGNAEIIAPEDNGAITKVNSEAFLCDFNSVSNRAEKCQSTSKAKANRKSGRDLQNLEADRMAVVFLAPGSAVDYLQADGKARFTQDDANGSAEKITYRPQRGMATLQGAPVQFWDSRGRSRARTVEWDISKRIAILNGDVSTTFYNQEQTSGALPFREKNSPVYVTANKSVVKISDDSVVFEGRARAWQKDNFISAETLEINRSKRTLIASGGVRTLLFDMPRGTSANSLSAVSGSAGSFKYSDATRIAVYETAVDLRQGQDRVQGASVTVRIGNDRGVQSFNVKGDVVLTQIGRRATGDDALYDLVERKVSLKGSPARVVETGRGAAEGGTLTYFLDDKRVVGEGRSEGDLKGRVRSVYQIDKQ